MEFVCQLAKECPLATAAAHGLNLFVRELGLGMLLTGLVSAQVVIVLAVLFGGSPAEVLQPAIGLDPVQVLAFLAFGIGADEGFEHEAMDTEGFVVRASTAFHRRGYPLHCRESV